MRERDRGKKKNTNIIIRLAWNSDGAEKGPVQRRPAKHICHWNPMMSRNIGTHFRMTRADEQVFHTSFHLHFLNRHVGRGDDDDDDAVYLF